MTNNDSRSSKNPTTLYRASHKKSRTGCQECKRRHVKCDERRPICAKCRAFNRVCQYSHPSPKGTKKSASATRSYMSDWLNGGQYPESGSGPSSPPLNVTSVINNFILRKGGAKLPSPETSQPFTIDHIYLLNHLLTGNPVFTVVDDFTKPFLKASLDVAFVTPYVMDALLALAALHLAEVFPSKADHYSSLATNLQTRALEIFNKTKPDLSDTTCVPLFHFTAVIGILALHKTLRNHREEGCFQDFLASFADYLDIHRVVRGITASMWQNVRENFPHRSMSAIDSGRCSDGNPEAIALHEMLDQSNLEPSPLAACREAVEVLGFSFDTYRSLAKQSAHRSPSVMAFGTRINIEFIHLLRQYQPEALIIISYYSVLLQWSRDFWVIGDAGQFMLDSISNMLDEKWRKLLVRPRDMMLNAKCYEALSQ
ncbi:Upc2 protein [Colletotrichum truncatum]|uniref:Upc2 protein n=1 Tax=Colletotrichum truncatum TaxID=5467 RepID=A0ACC3YF42_COLTU|nr:Upc2 protein [Colletotrichum truncatum]KAF6785013.1 Upc2 protein [Colletotrichum truncatum]